MASVPGKKSFLILASLVVIAAAVTWWPNAGQHEPVAPDVQVAEEYGGIVAEESIFDMDQESGQTSLLEEDAQPARRRNRQIVHVPDNRSRDDERPISDEREISATNIEHLLQANLDRALQGEMASAYFVARTRMACDRFASTPEELERRIQRVNRQVERGMERGRDFPSRADNWLPVSITADAQSNRAQLENWHKSCQNVQAIFTPDLRYQLELLALDGDVMARYLYATWPLEQLDIGEGFDQQFRWEGLARDFSQANLDSGEVAGLMAFAQSYLSGWFTDRNSDLALAFAIATTHCGFETSSLNGFLSNRIDHLTYSEDPADQQRLQFALTEADRLGQSCRH